MIQARGFFDKGEKVDEAITANQVHFGFVDSLLVIIIVENIYKIMEILDYERHVSTVLLTQELNIAKKKKTN